MSDNSRSLLSSDDITEATATVKVTVLPEKDKGTDKDKDKKDPKTFTTGINNLSTLYLSIFSIAGTIIVNLFKKKRFAK